MTSWKKDIRKNRTAADKVSSAKLMSGFEYIGFWARVIASLIDAVAYYLIYQVALMIFGSGWVLLSIFTSASSDLYPPGGSGLVVGNLVIFFAVFLLYELIFEFFFCIWCSATPGKIALRLKIVDSNTGRKPRMHQFMLRSVIKAFTFFPLFGNGLGFIYVALSRRKQGIHDIFSGTAVVSTSSYDQSDLEFRRGITPGRPSTKTQRKQDSNSPANPGSEADEIAKLALLRDKGTLTEEEFQLKKRQILGL